MTSPDRGTILVYNVVHVSRKLPTTDYFNCHHEDDNVEDDNVEDNLFNLLLDYTLYVYRHRYEEMDTGHIRIPC